ncbi:uncharacterized protein [Dermacentor andersoni]|uniref:uncharacterized protein isoform X2 n=1 Tax=Dermacentor andersoni TaxID=34620 RepID=UPI003B3B3586
MAGKETARPYFTMSGGNCNVGQGTSSAASDLDISRKSPPRRSVRDEATVARKEAARPYFTMSSGHYNLAQGTSSAPYDLDECSSRRNQTSSVSPARQPGCQQNPTVRRLPVRFHRHESLPTARRSPLAWEKQLLRVRQTVHEALRRQEAFTYARRTIL